MKLILGSTKVFALGKELAYAEDLGYSMDNIANLHMWKKTTTLSDPIAPTYKLTNQRTNLQLNIEINLPNAYVQIKHSDTVTVDQTGTGITMNNATSTNITLNNPDIDLLSGKFFMITSKYSEIGLAPGISMNKIYYMPAGSYLQTDGHYYLYAETIYDVVGVAGIEAGTNIEYLASVDRNEYTEGTVDNVTIEYLGQIGEFGDKPNIITGSYIGTGSFGENHANYIDFPDANSVPKILFIITTLTSKTTGGNNRMGFGIISTMNLTRELPSGISIPYFKASDYTYNLIGGSIIVVVRDNRLYWYCEGTSYADYCQLNLQGIQYNYIGIY